MARQKNTVIEYRDYNLPTNFPILLLTGEVWRISDIPSNRLHFHNCFEIGLCESDGGFMKFGEGMRAFNAGDITLVGSNVVHTTYSSPGTASKWTYIFVDLEELLAPYFPLNLFLDPVTLNSISRSYYSILPGYEHPELRMLLNEVVKEMQEKKENYQYSVRGLFVSFLVHLTELYKSIEAPSSKEPSPARDKQLVIAPALDYIHNNYMQDFTIDDLAHVCEMSPTHFRRMFQSIMGTNPLDYLNNYRITKASMLLRSTEIPVLEISEEVGFRSVSSFNRHFADITGTSPLKWRKQMSFIENKSVLKYTGWMVPEK
ncbi:MAG: helix-turn-helix transcriptional regulator [Lachnospiraceae bacterium]|nr:helix-turn-helix transcriptional regulator [Lachnospiraceae bacterium]MBO4559341.1 helix-turn-helix transcriptional regulator [Lachnospiraceae bacterium]MBR5733168.1 helix-turn-helix transcriptional regulator [Lachnospiraceae bacterium]